MTLSHYAGVKISSPAVLAPMSGVSTLPFRLLCKELGAAVTYTEFSSATAIARNLEKKNGNNRVFQRVQTVKEERPCAVQLFAPNEKDLVTAIEFVEKDFDFIDINFGCPSPKIVGGGCGAYLLKEPKKLISLIKAVVSISKKPITCKLRIGWNVPVLHEFVSQIENAGVQGIAVHGRTALQGYCENADWNYIQKIKSLISIPLIGNGDIHTAKEAMEKIENDFCDLVMIGRGAWNNPSIFAEIAKKEIIPSKNGILQQYFELCEKYPITDLADVKAQVSGILSGSPNVKKARVEMMQAKELVQVQQVALSVCG